MGEWEGINIDSSTDEAVAANELCAWDIAGLRAPISPVSE